jgi:N-succinyldiaminopimelate aminotransferase
MAYTTRPFFPLAARMNPALASLQSYPFERLATLRAGIQPNADFAGIDLSIGEPGHATPEFIKQALVAHLDEAARYPTTAGTPALRRAVARWLERRFGLDAAVDADTQVLPVNGTREALFAVAQFVVDRSRAGAIVVMPNPFYQIYEGATLLAGAEPYFVNCSAARGFVPDFDAVPDAIWDRCQLLYLCSPGNPTGAVLGADVLAALLERADAHDFVIAADECYSEIYPDEATPPAGLLQIARAAGREDFRRCLVFHSLSKRSNVPGMRSGFVAGDAELIRGFLRYRTYHGSAMARYTQAASIAAWNDEAHVRDNRARYRAKFDAVLDILAPVLPVSRPAGGFYLWPEVPGDDQGFARELYARYNVSVLPGSYLARDAHGDNPGRARVRLALVPALETCVEAAHRIRAFIRAEGAGRHRAASRLMPAPEEARS